MRSVSLSTTSIINKFGRNLLSSFSIAVLIVAMGGGWVSAAVAGLPPVENIPCLAAPEYNPPNSLGCTAGDVTLSSPFVTSIKECNFPGDTTILEVLFDVTVTSTERYDLGLWFSVDGDPNGDGSRIGVCSAVVLPSDIFHNTTIPNTLLTELDGDTCGDVTKSGTLIPQVIGANLGQITLLCNDLDGDGFLDVPVIITWDNTSNNVCNSAQEARPNTGSKCREVPNLLIPVPIPGQITVDKITVPSDATDFQFHLTGPALNPLPVDGFTGTADFQLNDASPAFDTAVFAGGLTPGTYTVIEDPDSAYVTEVACTGSEGAEDPSAIDVSAGETVNCVFTNTLDAATINVVKNTLGGNGVFTVNWAGPTTAGAVGLDTGVINTDTEVIVTTETGSFTLVELIPGGWELSNAACVDDNGGGGVGTWDAVDTINGILLTAGDSVTCTFTNSAQGSVSLIKTSIGGDGSFDFVTNVPGLGTNIQTSGGTGGTSASNVPTGIYSIVETVPAGWNLDSATCNDGSSPDALDVSVGETVTCTFTNTKLGTVIVEKQTLPDGSGQSFDFTGNIAGTIGDGEQIVVSNLLPSTYTSTESSVAGWNLTSIVCDDVESTTPSIGDVPSATATFNIEAGETVTCVFTNTQDGSIEVVKSLSATGPLNETFGFTSNFNGTFDLIGHAATTGAVAVAPGSGYTVSEDDPGANGWANTGASCGDGSDPLADIVVSPGEAVVCTFTNSPLGSATVIKDTIGGNGIFGFTGDVPIGPFSLDTTDQFTATTGDLFDFILAAGIYDVTEDNIPAGWTLTDIGCDDDSITDLSTATASMDVLLAESVTCTFTNTADGTLIIRKETSPDASPQGFDFTGDAAGTLHDYSDTAEQLSVSGLPGTYTSAESVPEGWILNNISCTGQVQSTVSIGGTGAFVPGDTDVSVGLVAGETVICSFNNALQGSITIEKFTQGDVGEFMFNGDFGAFLLNTAANGNPDSKTFTQLSSGTYMVSEIVPENWTLTDIVCTDAEQSTVTIGGAGGFDPGDQGVTIDLLGGESINCTFVNSSWATIAITKQTLPDGSSQSFDFTGEFNASLMDNQVASVRRPAGQYNVTESALAGWDLTSINCGESISSGDVPSRTANFDVTWGETAGCTFTNTQQGTITLVKNLPNDNGGDAVATDFTAFIDANPVPWGVPQELVPGSYTASETTLPGYAASAWFNACAADGSVTLGPGENLVCEITNDDIAPTLTLMKTVINNNGGLLTQADFPSFVNGVGQAWGVATAAQANTLLTASETTQAGYAPGAWGGDCATDGTIMLLPGDAKTCIIINDDVAPLLTLIKDVINDGLGTALPDDFLPTVGGVIVVSGQANTYGANVSYAINETMLEGYSFVSITGDDMCPEALGGTVTMDVGDDITCVITNNGESLPAVPVPTLSTWAMLLMILLMTGFAGWYFRPVQMRRSS